MVTGRLVIEPIVLVGGNIESVEKFPLSRIARPLFFLLYWVRKIFPDPI